MPTHERYSLNELQQATLEVLAGQTSMSRDEIIEEVQLVPGLDDVRGTAMGPCLAALKRRGLAVQNSPLYWSITLEGRGYVSEEEGEPETLAPAPAVDPAPAPAPVEHVGPSAGASTTACDDQMAPDPDHHAEPSTKEDHGDCLDCGRALTGEEAHYYEHRCEDCERAAHEALQAYREELQPVEASPVRGDRLARGLERLVGEDGMAARHDLQLQDELCWMLSYLHGQAYAQARQSPEGGDDRQVLFDTARELEELRQRVARALIVADRCPQPQQVAS